jgi:FtsP/CotA-like multicopper oxidase with cupredoxin domain
MRRHPVLTLALVLGTLAGLVVVLIGAGVGYAWWSAGIDTRGEVAFTRPMAVPPLAPSRTVEGVRTFSLTAREGRADLGGEHPSRTWGFDGDHLGPTLRATRGERVAVEVRNTLPESTSVHWHGMHLPAAMDGGPHQLVGPGDTWRPTWTVDQPAATLWYHPHPHGRTADHVARGLAGFFLLDDPEEEELGLPHDYGRDDLPILLQDTDLRRDGSLVSSHGRTVIANGTPGAYVDVHTQRVRLRLLNASTMRVLDVQLDDGSLLDLVATDGGLLPEPEPVDHLRLSPGERAELVVTMEPGERRVLQSVAPRLGGNPLSDRFDGGGAAFDVLQLRAAGTLAPSAEVPAVLSTTNLATAGDERAVDRTRDIRVNGRSINGLPMDPTRIDFAPVVDTTELWVVRNTAGNAHNLHVHDVQFRVLSVDGRAPAAEYAGLQDTIYLEPGVEYRVLMRFTDHTDPDVPFMVHCHLLRHEDEGMMSQFVVVRPGEQPGTPPLLPVGSHHG